MFNFCRRSNGILRPYNLLNVRLNTTNSEQASKTSTSPPLEITWNSLGIRSKFLDKLNKYGIHTPTLIQRMAIPPLLKGRSLMFSGETG